MRVEEEAVGRGGCSMGTLKLGPKDMRSGLSPEAKRGDLEENMVKELAEVEPIRTEESEVTRVI
ncbi:unnamed protein product [Arabis nemorensis]|uniref:Uncharacterized protein n=1 Tax=Arabis nemorensis TaxID=586526 RepID=A0A565ASV1_9BRAS|nr:unnamed protein product [Arabis nemorensis]